MSTDSTDAAPTLPPPSPLRRYTFDDISVLARYAVHVDGDPRRVYCFDAREIEFDEPGEWVRPPAAFDDEHDFAGLRAYWYAATSGDVVFYYLENMPLCALGDSNPDDGDVPVDRLPSFAACLTVFELHELSHWALGECDDQPGPADTEHWAQWNAVLGDVVAYVWDGEIDWHRPEDADLWYAETAETRVETPVGEWRRPGSDDAPATDQATLAEDW